MKASISTALAALLFGGVLTVIAATQAPATSRCHVLLLDSSGSMRPRYANGLKGWLIEPLLSSGAFKPSDHVIVRWFHHRGRTDFDPNDPMRRYNEKYNAQAVADATPTASQANGMSTDLPEALDLALSDLRGMKLTDEALIWMVTDNDQDANGSRDADALYGRISGDKNFHAAYLFPLTKENGKQLTSNESALVMYLLHYSTRSSPPDADSIAEAAGKKIGNDPITWIPVAGRLGLDESNIIVNSQPAQIVDGKLILPIVQEGSAPEFSIQFRFTSRLRGREIEHGRIAPEGVTLAPPSSVETVGDPSSWRAELSPTGIRIRPRQQLSNPYTAVLSAPSLTFHPASFWEALWNSESEPVDASLRLSLLDTKTKLDAGALSNVKNLVSIQGIVQRSQSNNRPIAVPMTFRIGYNTLWRRTAAAIAALLVLTGLCACASIPMIKSKYTLTANGEERVLTLPLIARSYIPIDGENAAVITRKFGKLKVAPLGLYRINGGHQPVPLKENDSFLIHDETGRRAYPHEINRRVRVAVPASVDADPFYD